MAKICAWVPQKHAPLPAIVCSLVCMGNELVWAGGV